MVHGNERGRHVFEELRKVVATTPVGTVLEISLAGIEATDVSFARESVVSLAKLHRCERGFFLTNFGSQDLIDNWDSAAKAKDQAIVIERGRGRYDVLGPSLSNGARELFEFAIKEGTVTTSMVVEQFNLSAPNASARLKKLYSMGLLLGAKETAETGGLEYVYRAIRRF